MMCKERGTIFCLLVVAVCAMPAMALFEIGDKGTSGAQFLKLPVGARAAAMGEAYSSVTKDADALHWNPAALASLSGRSASFSHTALFGELNHDFLAYAQPFGKGAVGAGVQYLSAGKVMETDDFGFETGGVMRPRDMAVSLAYARSIGWAALGLSLKYIDSRLAGSASAFAADIGALVWVSARLKLAFAAQNLGGRLKFDRESDPLPVNYKLGTSWEIGGAWLGALDINFPRDNKPFSGLGAEYRFNTGEWAFSGRLGYNTRTAGDISGGGLSMGGGVGFCSSRLDYAFIPFGAIGAAHIFSLSAGF